MKYFTFLPRFHPQILAGIKCMTIRRQGKVQIGERFALRFWTGKPYRSRMGILGTATCTRRHTVVIDEGLFTWDNRQLFVIPDWIAEADGFATGSDMFDHFRAAGLPFTGIVHQWGHFEAAP